MAPEPRFDHIEVTAAGVSDPRLGGTLDESGHGPLAGPVTDMIGLARQALSLFAQRATAHLDDHGECRDQPLRWSALRQARRSTTSKVKAGLAGSFRSFAERKTGQLRV
jgi:hypothetical protein